MRCRRGTARRPGAATGTTGTNPARGRRVQRRAEHRQQPGDLGAAAAGHHGQQRARARGRGGRGIGRRRRCRRRFPAPDGRRMSRAGCGGRRTPARTAAGTAAGPTGRDSAAPGPPARPRPAARRNGARRMPSGAMARSTRRVKPGQLMVTTTAGRRPAMSATVSRSRGLAAGAGVGSTSSRPIRARSRMGNRLPRPWAAMASPPMPAKVVSGRRAAMARIRRAPSTSPLASPAMR